MASLLGIQSKIQAVWFDIQPAFSIKIPCWTKVRQLYLLGETVTSNIDMNYTERHIILHVGYESIHVHSWFFFLLFSPLGRIVG